MRPIRTPLLLAGLFVSHSVFSASTPSVDGDVISLPSTPGWYQVQRADWSEVCQSAAGGKCPGVTPGRYIVTNLNNSDRWYDITVEGPGGNPSPSGSSAPSVSGSTVTMPSASGWYQVQRPDWSEVCQSASGGSCRNVANGIYIVTNLSTGKRWSDITVGSGGASGNDDGGSAGNGGGSGGGTGGDSVRPTLGKNTTPPDPSWTRPIEGVEYGDPIYKTPNRRVSDASGTRFDRNRYSRRQAENRDGSLFLTYHGTGRYHVNHRGTLRLVRKLDIHPDSEPQWHPSDSSLIRHVRGGNASSGDLRYYETDVRTGVTRVIRDLKARVQTIFPTAAYMRDNAEGSPSRDGNRIAWIVYDRQGKEKGIVSYDVSRDRLLGSVAVRTDRGTLDWVSMSPTGKHVVAGYIGGYGAVVYGSDLRTATPLYSKDHSDIALDANGRDAYVYIDYQTGSRDAGWLMSVNLDTLERTRLINFYDDATTSMHISGKGYDRPGWVVISTYNCRKPGKWSCDKVFAVELQPDPTVVNLAHTYNCGQDYWTETQAVVNRAFTRVYYNSDAGRCTTEAEVYELTLPDLP